ncbi:MAG TPA: lysylphosphatidylglycerol synthase domain-containing protein [Candidatus Saccharimonadales bacterium]|nr:lysylphosphatidylglycerol synthase domain-containing protein [Candidatus Saccharimonadales bacterium]
MKKYAKTLVAALLLVATATVFAKYLHAHPEVLHQFKHLKWSTLVVLLALYAVWWGALAAVLQVTMHLYNKSMPLRENVMLSSYSSLLNFFGPGQSGPGLRAVYLKKKHGLGIKKYIFATLIYYAFYAIISAGMLFAGSLAWWKTVLGVLCASAASWVVLWWYARRSQFQAEAGMQLPILGWLFVATVVQALAQFIIYFVEISTVKQGVGIGQALTYTGAANFALFVALTPGAIGIRESFLLFTEHLHHLGSGVIVAANVIDRAAYLVVLGILFIVVLALHAGKKLKLHQLTSEVTAEKPDTKLVAGNSDKTDQT